MRKLTDEKAPGYDSITSEELKAAGTKGIDILHRLCCKIWQDEEFPNDWGKSIINPIYKKKDKLDCGNYRGISLLSHAGKVFAIVLQQRILGRTEEILSEAQAGFRPGRSTVDQLFTLRQIIERHLEKNQEIYCCYIDFEKAFDSVSQEGLWKAMKFFGYPAKYITLLQALYNKSKSAVRVNGELTDWFRTTVGVRQGCILSPQLFNILLELVMLYATHDSTYGVMVSGHRINNLRFADDIALIAASENSLQLLVDSVNDVSRNYGLKINIKKTEVQVISRHPHPVNININNTKLAQVEKFVYLGGTITQSGSCTEDVQHRIGKALGAFQALNKIWESKDIRCATKIELYKVMIVSILLYGAETWTLRKTDESKLHTFEMNCLRKILGVTRLDRIRNVDIRERVGMKETVNNRIAIKRMRYFGHINRMHQSRLPAVLLHGYIQGNRSRGRPMKRWIEGIKADIAAREVNSLAQATHITANRSLWRGIVSRAPSLIRQDGAEG